MYLFGTNELGYVEYSIVISVFLLIAGLDYIIAQKLGYSTIDNLNTILDTTGKPFFKKSGSFLRISVAIFVIGLIFVATVIGYLVFYL